MWVRPSFPTSTDDLVNVFLEKLQKIHICRVLTTSLGRPAGLYLYIPDFIGNKQSNFIREVNKTCIYKYITLVIWYIMASGIHPSIVCIHLSLLGCCGGLLSIFSSCWARRGICSLDRWEVLHNTETYRTN